jgi:hypothetical protein
MPDGTTGEIQRLFLEQEAGSLVGRFRGHGADIRVGRRPEPDHVRDPTA